MQGIVNKSAARHRSNAPRLEALGRVGRRNVKETAFPAFRHSRRKQEEIIVVIENLLYLYAGERNVFERVSRILETVCYIRRSFGFSILPVGLRGTGAKMILRGRL